MSSTQSWLKAKSKEYLLSSLAVFCRDTRSLPDFREQPHREMCDSLQDIIEPEFFARRKTQHKGVWLAPRHSYKTSILAAAMCYLVLKYPNIRIAFGRATHDDAKTVLFKVKQILQTNAVIKDTWGDLSEGALIWSEEAITVGTRTEPFQEPTIDTTGIGISKTGFHPDVVILDDLVNDLNYRSQSTLERSRTLVQSFFPILPPHGTMVLCGTRWSYNDVYGWIMDEDDAMQEEENNLALRENREPRNLRQWTRYIRSVYDGPDGLFFPDVLTPEFIENQKRALRTNMMLFSSWYYNQPYEEGTKLFPKHYITYIDAKFYRTPAPHLETAEGEYIPLYVTMTIDPAPTAGPKSDFTGVVVVGCDANAKWYILWAEAFRRVPSEAAKVVTDLIRVYQPEVIGIETGQADPEFVARIQVMLRDYGLKGNIQSYSALQDEKRGVRGKDQRIEALQPIFDAGGIVFRRGAYVRDLLAQMDTYPTAGGHDDVLDALAMQRVFVRRCKEQTRAEQVERALERAERDEERDSWGPGGPPSSSRRVVSNVGLSSQTYRHGV